jgi:hypothetical protein
MQWTHTSSQPVFPSDPIFFTPSSRHSMNHVINTTHHTVLHGSKKTPPIIKTIALFLICALSPAPLVTGLAARFVLAGVVFIVTAKGGTGGSVFDIDIDVDVGTVPGSEMSDGETASVDVEGSADEENEGVVVDVGGVGVVKAGVEDKALVVHPPLF